MAHPEQPKFYAIMQLWLRLLSKNLKLAIWMSSILLLSGLALVWSYNTGNKWLSGHPNVNLVHQADAKRTYEAALKALDVANGGRIKATSPLYNFTYVFNILPAGTKEGFMWVFKPGQFDGTFQKVALPNATQVTKLRELGWRSSLPSGEPLGDFAEEVDLAMAEQDKIIKKFQADAQRCGPTSPHCLADAEAALRELDNEPLDVDLSLSMGPYDLYLMYEVLPTEPYAELRVLMKYGCVEKGNTLCSL